MSQFELKIPVADIRDAFYRWNKKQYASLAQRLDVEAVHLIHFIPLFLHLNHRLLPGYSGTDTPSGVHAYVPEKSLLYEARKLNNKFRYQQEVAAKHAAIDAVYFQQQIVDRRNLCWIFIGKKLNDKQIDSITQKVDRISRWYLARNCKIEFIVTSENNFRQDVEKHATGINASLYIERFYAESIVLAGKYPAWWLVPTESESEYDDCLSHMRDVRFVDDNDFLDFGSISTLKQEVFLDAAIRLLQNSKRSKELCLIELLLLDAKSSCWPEMDGVACRIKNSMYLGVENDNPVEHCADILHERFTLQQNRSHIVSPLRLFSSLKNMRTKLNYQLIDAFIGDSYAQPVELKGLDKVISILNTNKAMSVEIREVFSSILSLYISQDANTTLAILGRNMLLSLTESNNRVPVYNSDDVYMPVLDRILIRHEIQHKPESLWSLNIVLPEDNEKRIEGFSSLLGLLAWSWLNNIVNISTQVSIVCPLQQVKQTEARYVLDMLMQRLSPSLVKNISSRALQQPVVPVSAILVVNFMIEEDEALDIDEDDDPLSYGYEQKNLLVHCEMLEVDSWGEVNTRSYSGNSAVLKCICEWTHHAPLDTQSKPQAIYFSGYGPGNSTYMAQRIQQVYENMQQYFYESENIDGRFIVLLASNYFVISAEDGLLLSNKIGDLNAMFRFLEAPLSQYQGTELERLAYTEHPLKEIYQRNKAHVVQVFFQVINRTCYSWVLDEKGSLFKDIETTFNRESFLSHWLHLFDSICQRLKKINYQERELPVLEIMQITINRLGAYQFDEVRRQDIVEEMRFHQLGLRIVAHSDADQLSLSCDGKAYDYASLQQAVIPECVKDIKSVIRKRGWRPVYVTDVDVPLRLYNVTERDSIQVSHILKFKRSFEKRIRKLLML